jgi:exonuclease III
MSPLVSPCYIMDNVVQQYKMLNWNIRGLNNKAKQEDIRHVINMFNPDVICLQETKLESVDNALIRNALGPAFDNNYACLPAQGVRGGILIATNSAVAKLSNPSVTNHTISTLINDSRCNTLWMVIGVYGPQGSLEKKMLIRELRHLKQGAKPEWLMLEDFNLVCMHQDKSNGRVIMTLISRFQRAIDHLQLRELNLMGKIHLEQQPLNSDYVKN